MLLAAGKPSRYSKNADRRTISSQAPKPTVYGRHGEGSTTRWEWAEESIMLTTA
jgi:hypothetical protein